MVEWGRLGESAAAHREPHQENETRRHFRDILTQEVIVDTPKRDTTYEVFPGEKVPIKSWTVGVPFEPQARAQVERFAEAGVSRIMLQDFIPRDLDHIDQMAEFLF